MDRCNGRLFYSALMKCNPFRSQLHLHSHFRCLWQCYITIHYLICALINSSSICDHLKLHIPSNWRLNINCAVFVSEKKYECLSEGYQKDPDNCAKFYRCVKGDSEKLIAYHFDCGPGTVYSEETSNCVHPDMAGRPECENISSNEIDTGGKVISVWQLITNNH